MNTHPIDPDETLWQESMADLAFACAQAYPPQGAALIRMAHALLRAVPQVWQGHFAGLLPATAITTLLAAGGETAAALALLEGRAGYMLSHGPGGQHMASVVFGGHAREASATGESAALALIGALAASLAGPALDENREGLAPSARAPMRLN